MDTKQPEALQLANMLRGIDARSRFVNEKLSSASDELERLHAENERLRTYNKDARHEIANLQERVQQLGQLARDVNSRRVTELEAQLAAVAAPKKWAPEEVEDGGRGIRWVTNEGVHGRPTDHDVREYLKRTPTANGCHCDDCKRFYAAASDVTAAPAQAARAGWNACLRNLFSLTDQTGDEAAARETSEFMRGRVFEAKGVARAMNSFGPEHCDDLQAYFTPPAAPVDADVQQDAERLDFLIAQRAYVVSDPSICDGYWLHYARPNGETWVQSNEHTTPRAAIDAARAERIK